MESGQDPEIAEVLEQMRIENPRRYELLVLGILGQLSAEEAAELHQLHVESMGGGDIRPPSTNGKTED